MASRPRISAVICTRNRSASTVMAVQSILSNSHSNFELILVDQSTDAETEHAVASFHMNPRFQYVRMPAKGLGKARNLGLQLAQAEIVAFTDDDCRVPTNWLEVIESTFTCHPRVTVIFSNVEAGPHDTTAGFIPAYHCRRNKVIRNFWDKCRARGIGASMAVRRDDVLAMGGFDEMLGVGSVFPSCEDADIAIRALALGQWVYESAEVSVTHYGFRTWWEGKALAQRDWRGIGASYIKPLRAGHWGSLIIIFYEILVPCFLEPMKPMLRLRRPRGFGRMVAFFYGFIGGMQYPLDSQHITYQQPPEIPVIIGL
ncbi:MAG: glycosyltransferase family A protein [Chloroflexales bacterium]